MSSAPDVWTRIRRWLFGTAREARERQAREQAQAAPMLFSYQVCNQIAMATSMAVFAESWLEAQAWQEAHRRRQRRYQKELERQIAIVRQPPPEIDYQI
jgi:hypothetical protein